MFSLAALMSVGLAPQVMADDAQSGPDVESSSGIEVLDTRKVEGLDRTYEIDIASDEIGSHAYHGDLQLRVTLPDGYFEAQNNQVDYPVQYVLHGQGGRSSDWTEGTNIEEFTADEDLIIVTPEGGSGGWYTDWEFQSWGTQNLETFHIEQVIPFIDHNFRTIAAKEGRAISGFSMGGFGAIHYAGRHSDMFAYASSFSGGLNLENQLVRGAVLASPALNGFGPHNGAFGLVVWPNDVHWKDHNPLRMGENYRNLAVSLYTGSGLGSGDLGFDAIEAGAAQSTVEFHNKLVRLDIPHHYNHYGNPGTLNGEPCDGGHNWSCVNGAYKEDLPIMMEALADATNGN